MRTYQFIDADGEYSGLYQSTKSPNTVQQIVSKFYYNEMDGDLTDYLEEHDIHRIFAESIEDF